MSLTFEGLQLLSHISQLLTQWTDMLGLGLCIFELSTKHDKVAMSRLLLSLKFLVLLQSSLQFIFRHITRLYRCIQTLLIRFYLLSELLHLRLRRM